MTETDALDRVCQVLKRLLLERGIDCPDLERNTSIVDDLGFDSLDFVDLTIELEQETGLEEFPMQAWADTQLGSEGLRFSVGALAAAVVDVGRERHA